VESDAPFARCLRDTYFIGLAVRTIICRQPGFVHVYYVFGANGYTFSEVNDVTDNGTVVGQVEDHNSGAFVAFSRTADGKFTIFDAPIQFSPGSAAGMLLA